MEVAVINCGSSSIKYEVFGVHDCAMLATRLVEKIGSNDSRLRQRRRNPDGELIEQVHSKRLSDLKNEELEIAQQTITSI